MMLRGLLVVVMVLIGWAGYAQEQETGKEKKKSFRPDIPGSFMVELGVNLKSGPSSPSTFVKGFWGSRTVNLYYQYPIRLFKSNFSLNPGIGLSLERWKFTNIATLGPNLDTAGTYPLVNARTIVPGTIRRSQLVNNYLEIPIELRFDTNPEDIARSFNISFGGRVGVLFDSFTKIDYSFNGENRTLKDKQNHGMNPFRYGFYTRMGIGGFSWFGYFNASSMFEKGKGPEKTEMTSFTVGISINGF